MTLLAQNEAKGLVTRATRVKDLAIDQHARVVHRHHITIAWVVLPVANMQRLHLNAHYSEK